MWAKQSRMRRTAAASVVALAVMGVGAGCGAVDHSGAGGAADGGPEPTFVPVTTAPDGSVGVTGGGSGAAGGGAAGATGGGGAAGGSAGGGETGGSTPGGAAGGSAGGGAAGGSTGGDGGPTGGGDAGGGAGGSASGGSTDGGSATTLPEVSDRDRALVAFCSGVFDFQKAGLKLLTTASIDPNSVGAAAVDFRRKFEAATTAAPQDISADLGPMLGALQQAVPLQDVRLPSAIIADLNRALGAADAALGQAFGTMSRVCPRQVPADTVDQYRSFQLGASVPEEFVAAVFGIRPI